jgi:hypothetical protein
MKVAGVHRRRHEGKGIQISRQGVAGASRAADRAAANVLKVWLSAVGARPSLCASPVERAPKDRSKFRFANSQLLQSNGHLGRAEGCR